VSNSPIRYLDPWGTINFGGALGYAFDAGGFATNNSGTYGYLGDAIGGATGATLGGLAGGPPGAFLGGLAGSLIGDQIGSLFDDKCAGQ
jgi:hypothetical protein